MGASKTDARVHEVSLDFPAEDAEDALIAHYVEPHPSKPFPADARIVGSGFSVWILVDALAASGQDIARVAGDYGIPEDAVRAAEAFYHRHRAAIDARAAANAAAFGCFA